MAVPPQLMQMLMQGKQQAQGPTMPGAPQAPPAPGGSPMATPQPNAGEKQAAIAQVRTAIDVLESVLGKLGSETPEGKAILQSLTILSKVFGQSAPQQREIAPMAIMNMLKALPMAPGVRANGNQPV